MDAAVTTSPSNATEEAAALASRRGIGVNHVTLVGRLTSNPETAETRLGVRATIRLATNERTEPEFHRVTFWGSLAQVVTSHLVKGRLIYVEGRLHNSEWQNEAGARQRSYEIIADNFQFLDRPTVEA